MRVFADSMRRVAVVALLVVSGHVAASNIWLEQASREVVAGWPRIEKGFTPTLLLKVFNCLKCLASCRGGCLGRAFYWRAFNEGRMEQHKVLRTLH